jgi:putative transposase
MRVQGIHNMTPRSKICVVWHLANPKAKPHLGNMQLRGFKYKLQPTAAQAQAFRAFSGVCRLVYNLALEQRRDFWRQYQRKMGQKLNYVAQARELKTLRAEYDWIASVSQTCQQQALRDLDKAFGNFFTGRAKYPTPRKKGLNDAFRFQGREVAIERLNSQWSRVRLPKIGWVKFRDTRPMRGICKNATVSSDALGWRISFACEIEHEAPRSELPAVGIDRGVANTLALSNGELLSLPDSLALLDRRKRNAQKVLARKKRGSNRRKKALARVSRLSARIARIRRDWRHKTALNIARRYGDVALEDLKTRNMTASAKGTIAEPGRNVRQKAGLNRAILAQGWQSFEAILAYKIEERGGTLTKVDPRYTSQTCSACGCIDRRSRESQARFVCVHCGHETHADTNAAVEILRRNAASMRVEGLHEQPVEA